MIQVILVVEPATAMTGAQTRPVTPVGLFMTTDNVSPAWVVNKFMPVRVTSVPVWAAPLVGDTDVTDASVVVCTNEPPAGPATLLIATTNVMVPKLPVTPGTVHVICVADTHMASMHEFSTPVAPYVTAGVDELRPNPEPVRVTTVVKLPSCSTGKTVATTAGGGVPLIMNGDVDEVTTPETALVSMPM